MYNNCLTDRELSLIKGGGEPVKPVTPPRDRYDDEEQAQSADSSGAEETHKWVEWLKKWLGNNK